MVFHYSRSREGAMAAVEEARRNGAAKVAAMHADFGDVGEAMRMAEEAIAFLGGIDVLVNNAGITLNRPFEQVTPEQFDTVYHVNIRAMYFVTQAAVKNMIPRGGGTVINVSSIHAYEGYQEHTVYAGTKGAIVAFTRCLAIEMAPKGVRVNAIAPGAVEVAGAPRDLSRLRCASDGPGDPGGVHRPAGGHRQSRRLPCLGRCPVHRGTNPDRRRRHDLLDALRRGIPPERRGPVR